MTTEPGTNRPALTGRDRTVAVVFGLWMVIGLFLDGWAHDNSKPATRGRKSPAGGSSSARATGCSSTVFGMRSGTRPLRTSGVVCAWGITWSSGLVRRITRRSGLDDPLRTGERVLDCSAA